MNADFLAANDRAFSFIGTAAFSAPGQLRYFYDGDSTYISGNNDSDLNQEFQLQLPGTYVLVAADFIL